jgi:threonine aldolase
MTAFEFVKTFLPLYKKIFDEELKVYIKSGTQSTTTAIEHLENRMVEKYFAEALSHAMRRQRELCAIEYWKGTDDVDWHVYEKIKHAQEPKTYAE